MNQEQLRNFKKLYGSRTTEVLSRMFHISPEQILQLAVEHSLGKDKRWFPGNRMPRWTKEQVELLVEMYPNESNSVIAQRVQRTVSSVVTKAHALGLKKDQSRLTQMGRENVSYRKDRQDPTT